MTMPPPPDATLLPAGAVAIARVGSRTVVEYQGHTWVWPDDGHRRIAYDTLVLPLAEEVARLRGHLEAIGRGEGLEEEGDGCLKAAR